MGCKPSKDEDTLTMDELNLFKVNFENNISELAVGYYRPPSLGSVSTLDLDIDNNMDFQIKTITNIGKSTIIFVNAFINKILQSSVIIPDEIKQLITSFAFNVEYFHKHGNCLIIRSEEFMYDTVEVEALCHFKQRENWRDLLGDGNEHDYYCAYGNGNWWNKIWEICMGF